MATALQFYWSIQNEIQRLNDEVKELEKNPNSQIVVLVKLSIMQSLKKVIDGVEG